ncbi:hypothetical protein FRC04_000277 [Tulasnella sp. 424]|nr:hypothetical protein FRC04_000277 [Tulasnella sp. 424]
MDQQAVPTSQTGDSRVVGVLGSFTLRDLIIHIYDSVPVDLASRNLERIASLPSMNIKKLTIGTDYPSQAADFQVASVVASFLKSQPTLDPGCPPPLEARQNGARPNPTRGPPVSGAPIVSRYAVRTSQLQIFHPGGLYVDSDDIKTMAQAWRNMEVLNLCGCATNATPVGTPLALLLDFAEEFSPRLRQLALNFLCDGELPKADVVWTSFPKPEVLGVGTSRLSSTAQAIAVGEFLASVCSEGTQLAHVTENLWHPNAFDTINWKSSPKASHWPEIAAVLESGQRLQKVASAKALKAKEFQKS